MDILAHEITKIGDFRSFGRIEVTYNRRKYSVKSEDILEAIQCSGFLFKGKLKGKHRKGDPTEPPKPRKPRVPKPPKPPKPNKFNIMVQED